MKRRDSSRAPGIRVMNPVMTPMTKKVTTALIMFTMGMYSTP
jgi:hypothetical protein